MIDLFYLCNHCSNVRLIPISTSPKPYWKTNKIEVKLFEQEDLIYICNQCPEFKPKPAPDTGQYKMKDVKFICDSCEKQQRPEVESHKVDEKYKLNQSGEAKVTKHSTDKLNKERQETEKGQTNQQEEVEDKETEQISKELETRQTEIEKQKITRKKSDQISIEKIENKEKENTKSKILEFTEKREKEKQNIKKQNSEGQLSTKELVKNELAEGNQLDKKIETQGTENVEQYSKNSLMRYKEKKLNKKVETQQTQTEEQNIHGTNIEIQLTTNALETEDNEKNTNTVINAEKGKEKKQNINKQDKITTLVKNELTRNKQSNKEIETQNIENEEQNRTRQYSKYLISTGKLVEREENKKTKAVEIGKDKQIFKKVTAEEVFSEKNQTRNMNTYTISEKSKAEKMRGHINSAEKNKVEIDVEDQYIQETKTNNVEEEQDQKEVKKDKLITKIQKEERQEARNPKNIKQKQQTKEVKLGDDMFRVREKQIQHDAESYFETNKIKQNITGISSQEQSIGLDQKLQLQEEKPVVTDKLKTRLKPHITYQQGNTKEQIKQAFIKNHASENIGKQDKENITKYPLNLKTTSVDMTVIIDSIYNTEQYKYPGSKYISFSMEDAIYLCDFCLQHDRTQKKIIPLREMQSSLRDIKTGALEPEYVDFFDFTKTSVSMASNHGEITSNITKMTDLQKPSNSQTAALLAPLDKLVLGNNELKGLFEGQNFNPTVTMPIETPSLTTMNITLYIVGATRTVAEFDDYEQEFIKPIITAKFENGSQIDIKNKSQLDAIKDWYTWLFSTELPKVKEEQETLLSASKNKGQEYLKQKLGTQNGLRIITLMSSNQEKNKVLTGKGFEVLERNKQLNSIKEKQSKSSQLSLESLEPEILEDRELTSKGKNWQTKEEVIFEANDQMSDFFYICDQCETIEMTRLKYETGVEKNKYLVFTRIEQEKKEEDKTKKSLETKANFSNAKYGTEKISSETAKQLEKTNTELTKKEGSVYETKTTRQDENKNENQTKKINRTSFKLSSSIQAKDKESSKKGKEQSMNKELKKKTTARRDENEEEEEMKEISRILLENLSLIQGEKKENENRVNEEYQQNEETTYLEKSKEKQRQKETMVRQDLWKGEMQTKEIANTSIKLSSIIEEKEKETSNIEKTQSLNEELQEKEEITVRQNENKKENETKEIIRTSLEQLYSIEKKNKVKEQSVSEELQEKTETTLKENKNKEETQIRKISLEFPSSVKEEKNEGEVSNTTEKNVDEELQEKEETTVREDESNTEIDTRQITIISSELPPLIQEEEEEKQVSNGEKERSADEEIREKEEKGTKEINRISSKLSFLFQEEKKITVNSNDEESLNKKIGKKEETNNFNKVNEEQQQNVTAVNEEKELNAPEEINRTLSEHSSVGQKEEKENENGMNEEYQQNDENTYLKKNKEKQRQKGTMVRQDLSREEMQTKEIANTSIKFSSIIQEEEKETSKLEKTQSLNEDLDEKEEITMRQNENKEENETEEIIRTSLEQLYSIKKKNKVKEQSVSKELQEKKETTVKENKNKEETQMRKISLEFPSSVKEEMDEGEVSKRETEKNMDKELQEKEETTVREDESNTEIDTREITIISSELPSLIQEKEEEKQVSNGEKERSIDKEIREKEEKGTKEINRISSKLSFLFQEEEKKTVNSNNKESLNKKIGKKEKTNNFNKINEEQQQNVTAVNEEKELNAPEEINRTLSEHSSVGQKEEKENENGMNEEYQQTDETTYLKKNKEKQLQKGTMVRQDLSKEEMQTKEKANTSIKLSSIIQEEEKETSEIEKTQSLNEDLEEKEEITMKQNENKKENETRETIRTSLEQLYSIKKNNKLKEQSISKELQEKKETTVKENKNKEETQMRKISLKFPSSVEEEMDEGEVSKRETEKNIDKELQEIKETTLREDENNTEIQTREITLMSSELPSLIQEEEEEKQVSNGEKEHSIDEEFREKGEKGTKEINKTSSEFSSLFQDEEKKTVNSNDEGSLNKKIGKKDETNNFNKVNEKQLHKETAINQDKDKELNAPEEITRTLSKYSSLIQKKEKENEISNKEEQQYLGEEFRGKDQTLFGTYTQFIPQLFSIAENNSKNIFSADRPYKIIYKTSKTEIKSNTLESQSLPVDAPETMLQPQILEIGSPFKSIAVEVVENKQLDYLDKEKQIRRDHILTNKDGRQKEKNGEEVYVQQEEEAKTNYENMKKEKKPTYKNGKEPGEEKDQEEGKDRNKQQKYYQYQEQEEKNLIFSSLKPIEVPSAEIDIKEKQQKIEENRQKKISHLDKDLYNKKGKTNYLKKQTSAELSSQVQTVEEEAYETTYKIPEEIDEEEQETLQETRRYEISIPNKFNKELYNLNLNKTESTKNFLPTSLKKEERQTNIEEKITTENFKFFESEMSIESTMKSRNQPITFLDGKKESIEQLQTQGEETVTIFKENTSFGEKGEFSERAKGDGFSTKNMQIFSLSPKKKMKLPLEEQEEKSETNSEENSTSEHPKDKMKPFHEATKLKEGKVIAASKSPNGGVTFKERKQQLSESNLEEEVENTIENLDSIVTYSKEINLVTDLIENEETEIQNFTLNKKENEKLSVLETKKEKQKNKKHTEKLMRKYVEEQEITSLKEPSIGLHEKKMKTLLTELFTKKNETEITTEGFEKITSYKQKKHSTDFQQEKKEQLPESEHPRKIKIVAKISEEFKHVSNFKIDTEAETRRESLKSEEIYHEEKAEALTDYAEEKHFYVKGQEYTELLQQEKKQKENMKMTLLRENGLPTKLGDEKSELKYFEEKISFSESGQPSDLVSETEKIFSTETITKYKENIHEPDSGISSLEPSEKDQSNEKEQYEDSQPKSLTEELEISSFKGESFEGIQEPNVKENENKWETAWTYFSLGPFKTSNEEQDIGDGIENTNEKITKSSGQVKPVEVSNKKNKEIKNTHLTINKTKSLKAITTQYYGQKQKPDWTFFYLGSGQISNEKVFEEKKQETIRKNNTVTTIDFTLGWEDEERQTEQNEDEFVFGLQTQINRISQNTREEKIKSLVEKPDAKTQHVIEKWYYSNSNISSPGLTASIGYNEELNTLLEEISMENKGYLITTEKTLHPLNKEFQKLFSLNEAKTTKKIIHKTQPYIILPKYFSSYIHASNVDNEALENEGGPPPKEITSVEHTSETVALLDKAQQITVPTKIFENNISFKSTEGEGEEEEEIEEKSTSENPKEKLLSFNKKEQPFELEEKKKTKTIATYDLQAETLTQTLEKITSYKKQKENTKVLEEKKEMNVEKEVEKKHEELNKKEQNKYVEEKTVENPKEKTTFLKQKEQMLSLTEILKRITLNRDEKGSTEIMDEKEAKDKGEEEKNEGEKMPNIVEYFTDEAMSNDKINYGIELEETEKYTIKTILVTEKQSEDLQEKGKEKENTNVEETEFEYLKENITLFNENLTTVVLNKDQEENLTKLFEKLTLYKERTENTKLINVNDKEKENGEQQEQINKDQVQNEVEYPNARNFSKELEEDKERYTRDTILIKEKQYDEGYQSTNVEKEEGDLEYRTYLKEKEQYTEKNQNTKIAKKNPEEEIYVEKIEEHSKIGKVANTGTKPEHLNLKISSFNKTEPITDLLNEEKQTKTSTSSNIVQERKKQQQQQTKREQEQNEEEYFEKDISYHNALTKPVKDKQGQEYPKEKATLKKDYRKLKEKGKIIENPKKDKIFKEGKKSTKSKIKIKVNIATEQLKVNTVSFGQIKKATEFREEEQVEKDESKEKSHRQKTQTAPETLYEIEGVPTNALLEEEKLETAIENNKSIINITQEIKEYVEQIEKKDDEKIKKTPKNKEKVEENNSVNIVEYPTDEVMSNKKYVNELEEDTERYTVNTILITEKQFEDSQKKKKEKGNTNVEEKEFEYLKEDTTFLNENLTTELLNKEQEKNLTKSFKKITLHKERTENTKLMNVNEAEKGKPEQINKVQVHNKVEYPNAKNFSKELEGEKERYTMDTILIKEKQHDERYRSTNVRQIEKNNDDTGRKSSKNKEIVEDLNYVKTMQEYGRKPGLTFYSSNPLEVSAEKQDIEKKEQNEERKSSSKKTNFLNKENKFNRKSTKFLINGQKPKWSFFSLEQKDAHGKKQQEGSEKNIFLSSTVYDLGWEDKERKHEQEENELETEGMPTKALLEEGEIETAIENIKSLINITQELKEYAEQIKKKDDEKNKKTSKNKEIIEEINYVKTTQEHGREPEWTFYSLSPLEVPMVKQDIEEEEQNEDKKSSIKNTNVLNEANKLKVKSTKFHTNWQQPRWSFFSLEQKDSHKEKQQEGREKQFFLSSTAYALGWENEERKHEQEENELETYNLNQIGRSFEQTQGKKSEEIVQSQGKKIQFSQKVQKNLPSEINGLNYFSDVTEAGHYTHIGTSPILTISILINKEINTLTEQIFNKNKDISYTTEKTLHFLNKEFKELFELNEGVIINITKETKPYIILEQFSLSSDNDKILEKEVEIVEISTKEPTPFSEGMDNTTDLLKKIENEEEKEEEEEKEGEEEKEEEEEEKEGEEENLNLKEKEEKYKKLTKIFKKGTSFETMQEPTPAEKTIADNIKQQLSYKNLEKPTKSNKEMKTRATEKLFVSQITFSNKTKEPFGKNKKEKTMAETLEDEDEYEEKQKKRGKETETMKSWEMSTFEITALEKEASPNKTESDSELSEEGQKEKETIIEETLMDKKKLEINTETFGKASSSLEKVEHRQAKTSQEEIKYSTGLEKNIYISKFIQMSEEENNEESSAATEQDLNSTPENSSSANNEEETSLEEKEPSVAEYKDEESQSTDSNKSSEVIREKEVDETLVENEQSTLEDQTESINSVEPTEENKDLNTEELAESRDENDLSTVKEQDTAVQNGEEDIMEKFEKNNALEENPSTAEGPEESLKTIEHEEDINENTKAMANEEEGLSIEKSQVEGVETTESKEKEEAEENTIKGDESLEKSSEAIDVEKNSEEEITKMRIEVTSPEEVFESIESSKLQETNADEGETVAGEEEKIEIDTKSAIVSQNEIEESSEIAQQESEDIILTTIEGKEESTDQVEFKEKTSIEEDFKETFQLKTEEQIEEGNVNNNADKEINESTDNSEQISKDNETLQEITAEVENTLGVKEETVESNNTEEESGKVDKNDDESSETEKFQNKSIPKTLHANFVATTIEIEKDPLGHTGTHCEFCDTTLTTITSLDNAASAKSKANSNIHTTTEIEKNAIGFKTTPCEFCFSSETIGPEATKKSDLELEATKQTQETEEETSEESQKIEVEVSKETNQTEQETTEEIQQIEQETTELTQNIEQETSEKTQEAEQTILKENKEIEEQKTNETEQVEKKTSEEITEEDTSEEKEKDRETPEQTNETKEEIKSTEVIATKEKTEQVEKKTSEEIAEEDTSEEKEKDRETPEQTNETKEEIKSTEVIATKGEQTEEHKPIVYVINDSNLDKKLNDIAIENIIGHPVDEIELRYIELNKPSKNITIDENLFEQCKEIDFENGKKCFCNMQAYVNHLTEKINHNEVIDPQKSYCNAFVKFKSGIVIKHSKKVRRRRGLIHMDDIKKKLDTIEHDGIEDLFERKYALKLTEFNIYCLPTENVRISCLGKKNSNSTIKDFFWKFYPLFSTEGKPLSDKSSEIIVHGASVKSAGNYTCSPEFDKDSPDKEHWHELELISFPEYGIISNIFYKINDSCDLQTNNALYTYLPKLMSSVLCASENLLCTVTMDEPNCLTREDDNYINVTVKTKLSAEFVLQQQTECDINCKRNLYENVVNMVYKNSEIMEFVSVFSELAELPNIAFIPHITGKQTSPVHIKPPRIVVSCPAGFGIESKMQRICVLCPPETYSAENEVFCKRCLGGQYQPEAGSQACIQCNSPVDDKMCLRMLYTDTNIFKIYVGMAFGLIILLIIVIIIWTNEPRDEDKNHKPFEGSLRHRAIVARHSYDVEKGLKDEITKEPRKPIPPEPPPVDF